MLTSTLSVIRLPMMCQFEIAKASSDKVVGVPVSLSLQIALQPSRDDTAGNFASHFTSR